MTVYSGGVIPRRPHGKRARMVFNHSAGLVKIGECGP